MSRHVSWMVAFIWIAFVAGTVQAEMRLDKINVVAGDPETFGVPAQVLVEEIARRTSINWQVSSTADEGGSVVFRAAILSDGVGPEGFRISTEAADVPRITIAAENRRGALFAVGYLLRTLDCSTGRVTMLQPVNITQSPRYAIRGHQLGYRAQANSYDAWDEKIYDQYIRELTFFGANCIENIPFQDERPTPIMPLTRTEMNRAMSGICDKYDVDYWVWTPADFDLTDLEKRKAAVRFHEAFYKDCPRLDAIFFPGGDPGDNHPREVMPFLEDLSGTLHAYHPKAKIWLSLQGFEGEKTDYFFDWLNEHKPDWLGGLVAGPGSPPLPLLRKRLDQRYQLRDYPDITHVVRCQYPERNLDQVFALTAGREPINPRPLFYADVFADTAPHTNGFLSYSDGCHDDVNKVVWSALGWDPDQTPRAILAEYARCFFSSADADAVADGILALEKNWDGPLRDNIGVSVALEQWQNLEQANPPLKDNWRWQMLLLRAYYDNYQRERLARETALEVEANRELEQQDGRFPSESMAAALSVLSQAEKIPVRPDLRNRILELFHELYTGIKFQSSVEKYHAINPQRGCMLDFLDIPLNNRFWLEDEFHKVRTLPTLETRWERLEQLRTWENPGPGCFYDDIGSSARSPHAAQSVGTSSFWWLDNGMSRLRLSWLVTGSPSSLDYNLLDPDSTYTLRFCGFGHLKPRADGRALEATRYETVANSIKEYPVPQDLVSDGKLSITFDSVYLEGVNWRFQPRLAEAWLIKATSP